MSTGFGWGKGGKVTAARWQVTLCDPIWYVIFCSSVVKFHKMPYTVYFLVVVRQLVFGDWHTVASLVYVYESDT